MTHLHSMNTDIVVSGPVVSLAKAEEPYTPLQQESISNEQKLQAQLSDWCSVDRILIQLTPQVQCHRKFDTQVHELSIEQAQAEEAL